MPWYFRPASGTRDRAGKVRLPKRPRTHRCMVLAEKRYQSILISFVFFFNWVFIFNYVNGVYACVGEVST